MFKYYLTSTGELVPVLIFYSENANASFMPVNFAFSLN
jgi:hypothetical protein